MLGFLTLLMLCPAAAWAQESDSLFAAIRRNDAAAVMNDILSRWLSTWLSKLRTAKRTSAEAAERTGATRRDRTGDLLITNPYVSSLMHDYFSRFWPVLCRFEMRRDS